MKFHLNQSASPDKKILKPIPIWSLKHMISFVERYGDIHLYIDGDGRKIIEFGMEKKSSEGEMWKCTECGEQKHPHNNPVCDECREKKEEL